MNSPTTVLAPGRMTGFLLWFFLAIAIALFAFGFCHEQLYLIAPWTPDAAPRLIVFCSLGIIIATLGYIFVRPWSLQAVLLGLFGLVLIVSGLTAIASLLLYAAATTTIGLALIAKRQAPEALDIMLAFGIGCAVLVVVYNFSIRLPVNYPGVHIALLFLPLFILRSHFLKLMTVVLVALRRPTQLTLAEYFVGSVISLLLAMYVIIAALPEVYHDPLAVYLYMASRLKSAGIWDVGPDILAGSAMPLGLVWTQAIFNLLGGEVAAKLSNVMMLAATAGLVFFATRAEAGKLGALLLVALLLSTAPFFLQTVTLFYDNGIAMLVACAFLLAIHPERPGSDRQTMFLVAIVLGGAAGSKITVLLIAPFFWAFFCITALRGRNPRAMLWPFLSGLAFLLAAGFPYLWSWIATGNPVFPLKNSLFRSPLFPLSDFATIYSQPLSWNLLYRLTFDTTNYMEGNKGSFGFFILFLLPLQLLGLFLLRAPLLRFGLILALGAGFALSLEQQYVRYYSVLFPLFLIATGPIISYIDQAGLRLFRGALFGCLLLLMLLSAYFMPTSGWAWRSFPIDMVWTEASRRDWTMRIVPHRFLIDAVEATTGSKARVLFVGRIVTANFSGIPLVYNWYNPKLSAQIDAARTEVEIACILQQNNVTHILLTPSLNSTRLNQNAIRQYASDSLRLIESLGGVELWSSQSDAPKVSACRG